MHLRQIALVAKDLAPNAQNIQAVLGLGEGYNDPGVGEFGLHNVVFPVGDTFLEIVSPMTEGTTGGRLLEKRGGDGGYMILFQTHRSQAEEMARMKDLGVRTIWNCDYEDAKGLHLHPKDVGGAIVSLDEINPPESWRWGGPDWERNTRRDVTTAIVGADIQSGDPAGMAARWAEVLGEKLTDDKGTPQVRCGDTFVRFVPETDGRGEGVAAFHVRATDREKVLQEAQSRGLPVSGQTVSMCGADFHIH